MNREGMRSPNPQTAVAADTCLKSSSKDDKGGSRSNQAEGFTEQSVTLSLATHASPRKDAHLAERELPGETPWLL